MGHSSEKKRKRVEEAVESDTAHASKKIQTSIIKDTSDGGAPTENKNELDSGKARQLKSERRSKRAKESKQGTVQKAKKATKTTASDGIANGEDFVTLSEETQEKSHETSTPQTTTLQSQPKENKIKKSSPRSIRKAAKADKPTQSLQEEGLVPPSEESKTRADDQHEPTTNGTPARFICFVGNLPYSATTAQIEAHFSKLAPKSVRHSTDKSTGKSKGFAFLEFESYDRMKTCLKSYHQSIFEPVQSGHARQANGRESKTQGRKLNVELTAGGGGNTQGRKEKIREKNNKLKEERTRKKEEEQKEAQDKLKKKREQDEKQRTKRNAKGPSGANAEVMHDTRGVHPSRLNRVPQTE